MQWKLLNADMSSGEISVLGETSIESLIQGVSIFHQENRYYSKKTDNGITVIDVEKVSVFNSFGGLTEIEYLNAYRQFTFHLMAYVLFRRKNEVCKTILINRGNIQEGSLLINSMPLII